MGGNRGKRNSGKKDKDKEKNRNLKGQMAMWEEIVDQSKTDCDLEEIEEDTFGMAHFTQASSDAKLNILMVALNKIHKTFSRWIDMLCPILESALF